MNKRNCIFVTAAIVTVVLTATTAFCAYSYAWKKAEEHYFLNDRSYIAAWNRSILANDSTYNYDVLRDLMLPSHYSNDTTTIEYVGYENGSVYYINHSYDEFHSVYFKDNSSYKLVVPLIGRVFLLEG